MIKNLTNIAAIACLAPEAGLADGMTGIATLDVYSAEPAARAEGKGPVWIKVAPRGRFTARDGRSFEVDPDVLVARFKQDGIDIPVDQDHSTVKKAMFGDAAPAVGWISELQARDDGLYGKVDWLDEGLRILTARTHRYISPSLKTDDNGKAEWLHSAALVAAPAASMPAIASADTTHKPETNMLKAIALALGLTEDASEASCLSALSTLQKRIDPAVHKEALDTLAAKTTELDTIRAEARKKEIDGVLGAALTAKKITPAQRDHYETLCATPEGFETVKKLIEASPAVLNASGLDNRATPEGDVKTLSAEDRVTMRQLGLSEQEYCEANGLTAA